MISLLDAITVVLVLLHNFLMIQLDACGEHIDLADNFQLMRKNSIRRKNHSPPISLVPHFVQNFKRHLEYVKAAVLVNIVM